MPGGFLERQRRMREAAAKRDEEYRREEEKARLKLSKETSSKTRDESLPETSRASHYS